MTFCVSLYIRGDVVIFIFVIIYLLFTFAFMYCNYNDLITLRICLKAICSFMFVLAPFLITRDNPKIKKTKYFKTLLLGLIFAFSGDVLLDLDNSKLGILFVLGMIGFVLTHIMYSISFKKYVKITKTTYITFLLLIIPTAYLINFSQLINCGDLTIVINIYAFIISFMVGLAATLYKKKELNKKFRIRTLVGVILFAISDLILLFSLFGNTSKILLPINNIVYYVAQMVICFSFYKIKHTYK